MKEIVIYSKVHTLAPSLFSPPTL